MAKRQKELGTKAVAATTTLDAPTTPPVATSAPDPGFEKRLFRAADALRETSMEAADCKLVVLGLIFLECISDAFADLASHRPQAVNGLRVLAFVQGDFHR